MNTTAAHEFLKAIGGVGLTPPESLIPDGKLHRFASNGKHGDDSGWYVFHDDGVPAGAFGDWRTDIKRSWRADIGRTLTPAEEAAYQRKVNAMRRAREEEEARRHAEAARSASSIWKTSTPASASHPYLARKQVKPVESLRDIDAAEAARILGYAPKSGNEHLAGRLLVVPVVKVAGELSTLEIIDELGRKSALYGGAKSSGYWEAQELPDGHGAGLTLLIGEGVATVLSAREVTGHLVIAALSSGNLLAVAREMRKRFPAAKLGLLADLVRATGDPDPHAIEAARAVGGLLVIPDFGEDRPERLKDFNDLAVLRGLEVAAECIRRQVDAGEGGPEEDEPRPGNGAVPGDESGSFSSAEGAPGDENEQAHGGEQPAGAPSGSLYMGSTASAKVPGGDEHRPGNGAAPEASRVILARGDDLSVKAPRWLWDGWLARGKLHVLAGRRAQVRARSGLSWRPW